MKKSILMLSAAVSLLIVASCSKTKETPDQDKEQNCKVKLVEYIHEEQAGLVTEKYYYSYDAQGRITRVDYGKEQSTEYETFTYTSNKVTWKGVGGDVETFNLDANGRATSVNQGSNVLNFKYNADGQLIEAAIGDDKQTLTYLNGNLSTSANGTQPWVDITNGNAVTGDPVVYCWLFGEVLDFDEIGYRITPYIGKLSKNLPSKIIYGRGAFQTTVNFTYTNDANGKLTSAKMVSSSNSSSTYNEEYRFTYDCK
jgi:YD repeat-containing protein